MFFFTFGLKNRERIVNICHANTPGSYLFLELIRYTQPKINRIIQSVEAADEEAARLNKQYVLSRAERSMYATVSSIQVHNNL